MSNRYDKLFITTSFVNNNEQLIEEIKEINIVDKNGIKLAPNIIKLQDHEKFHDDENNIVEIQTRGTRDYDNIYFFVKDVEKAFNMDNLSIVLLNEQGQYQENVDYIYFIRKKQTNNFSHSNEKIKVNKELFLTYQGILRVLFVSRNASIKKFLRWATEKLFTLQIGTDIQKEQLIKEIKFADSRTVQTVLDTNCKSVSCIYFFTLGTINDLREAMKIPDNYKDNDVIGIYGYTKDLSQRTNQHAREFNKIKNCSLVLKLYFNVDQQYLSQAESDVRKCMNFLNVHFNYENNKEMVVLSEDNQKYIEKEFKNLSIKYSEFISDINIKINDEKISKDNLIHQYEREKLILNNEKDKIIHEKDKIIHEKEKIISEREMELQKEKHEKEKIISEYEKEKNNLLNQTNLLKIKKNNIVTLIDSSNNSIKPITKKISFDTMKELLQEFSDLYIKKGEFNNYIILNEIKEASINWLYNVKKIKNFIQNDINNFFKNYYFNKKISNMRIRPNDLRAHGWRNYILKYNNAI